MQLIRKLISIYTRPSSSSPRRISTLYHKSLTYQPDRLNCSRGMADRYYTVKYDSVIVSPLCEFCEVVTGLILLVALIDAEEYEVVCSLLGRG